MTPCGAAVFATLITWFPATVVDLALTQPAAAYDIYSDDFNGSGDLSGTAPDVRPGSETWTASTTAPAWQADGTITGNAHRNAWLPFAPTAGNVYTASLDVNPNAPALDNDWFAFGFSAAAGTEAPFYDAGLSSVAWMLNRVRRSASSDMQTFLGPSTGGSANHTTTTGVVNLKVVLDTQPANWEVEWYRNGSLIRGPDPYGSNPTINHVGFGRVSDAAGTVDNFNLATSFYAAPWTADETSGISSDYDYTHAVNVEGNPVTINSVDFIGTSGGNPTGSNFSISGIGSPIGGDDSNTVAGSGAEMARRFIYNGNPGTVTLTGLTAGQDYTATLYSVGWDASGRNQTFTTGDAIHTIDQDTYGNNNGIRIVYDYTADATGSIVFTIQPEPPTGGTFHLYGFSNREAGPVVDNRSFEVDTFGTYPGYISGALNGPITSWTSTNDARIGINPAAGSPFADNGAIPDGTQVAFIQNSGGTGSLSQNVTSLVVGETYRVSYRYNARSSGNPKIKVTMGGAVLQETEYIPVGGTNPYYLGSYEFEATAPSATLMFENTKGAGDTTVLIDDVRITPASKPGWTIAAWNDDNSSGINSSYAYTHAVNFAGAAVTIKDVPFTAAAGTNPSGGNFSTTGMGSPFNNDSNTVTGASATMANDFLYGGATSSITMTGLDVGTEYVTTIYAVGFDNPPGSRIASFTATGGDLVTFNENDMGNNNGVRFAYRFTAESTSMTIDVDPYTSSTWHYYGFANYAVPEPSSFVLAGLGLLGLLVCRRRAR